MFASAGASQRRAAVLTPKPKVITPVRVVLSPKPTVPELSALVDAAKKQKGNRMIGVRLPPDLVSKVETWAAANGADTMPDAIRRLIELGLAKH